MHCYRYLAAVAAVSESIDESAGTCRKMPLAVVAEWMASNGIEAEQVLEIGGDEIRILIEETIQQDCPQLKPAA